MIWFRSHQQRFVTQTVDFFPSFRHIFNKKKKKKIVTAYSKYRTRQFISLVLIFASVSQRKPEDV